MKNPKLFHVNIKPDTIQRLGNNSYYYNYNITEYLENKEKRYSFILVHLYGLPNYKDCVRAVIREYVTQEEEFDLINSSNREMLNIKSTTDDKQKYIDYLKLVDEIKSKVKADFNNITY